MRRFAAPIGIDDFHKLRSLGATYVDKTAFISELLAAPTEVSLFPRPRRFGKTLALSTLRYFLLSGEILGAGWRRRRGRTRASRARRAGSGAVEV